MLKILLNPKKAKRHAFEFFIISIFYSSLSILVASLIFPEYSSIVMVFLSSISCLYVIQGAIKIEEQKEVDTTSEKNLLKKHSKLIKFILALFIGFVVAFAFWSFILPDEKVATTFELQDKVIRGIQSQGITGNAVNNSSALKIIIKNNLKVLAISFILSLFYAAGSIFIIVWNASIMGFAIGTIARNSENFLSLPVLFTKYFLHGIPEMLSYITIILTGNIIFISVLKKDIFREGAKKRVLIDTAILLIISILLVIISALIEVFISPLI
ncbi:MAG: stage II sporulation protein M [Candidatus Pacearchaeota archaeon]|jgi:uncharacterized membrane protein SpoIIM required for sporulation